MFAISTVETEPFLRQEFLAFVQGSHTRAIFGDVVSFFAVNACSFTTFIVLGVIKFDFPEALWRWGFSRGFTVL